MTFFIENKTRSLTMLTFLWSLRNTLGVYIVRQPEINQDNEEKEKLCKENEGVLLNTNNRIYCMKRDRFRCVIV